MMPSSDLRILVVDDFATMRRIVKNVLKQLGYTNVDEVEDGSKALDMLEQGVYQFVVSDWNMPVMDGLEMVKNIRSNPGTKDLPILMVTAEAEKDKVVEAIKAGVNNYIVKPFTAETMQEKIDKIFK